MDKGKKEYPFKSNAMTKPLRKRHLYMWLVLGLLLPPGILSAWLARPAKPIDALQVQPAGSAYTQVVDSVRTEKYIARMRCSENNAGCQLEYINRLALEVPSVLLYRMRPGAVNIDGHELLGRIGPKGSYYFAIPVAQPGNQEQRRQFILYDFIHQQVIDTIKF
jgi:hypothetical protein